MPNENEVAFVAYRLVLALVIVTCAAKHVTDYVEGDVGPMVTTRYSIGGNSEFLPPLDVGYFIGHWYALKRRDNDYSRWAPET